MKRIESIISSIYNIPIVVLASTYNDSQRKPQTLIWELFEKWNSKQVQHLLHVGNNAGREGDDNCEDRQFAMNRNVKFESPEEFFLGKRPELFSIPFFPKSVLAVETEFQWKDHISNSQELILLVGCPSSGKT